MFYNKLSFANLVCLSVTFVLTFAIPPPDPACMAEHCLVQIKNCLLDDSCRQAFLCMVECDTSNTTCLLTCMYSFEDNKLDDVMKCIVTDYKCLNVSPSDPFLCKRPTKIATNFTLDMLKGQWYIVRGMHPIYDCFNCAISTFNPKGMSPMSYNITERFDVKTIDGDIKHRVVTETVTQLSASTPGILRYTSLQMGLNTTSEWRVLDFGENYVFMYYCSDLSGVPSSEGSVVYSRSKTLDTTTINRLTTVAQANGMDFSKYCTTTFDNCPSK